MMVIDARADFRDRPAGSSRHDFGGIRGDRQIQFDLRQIEPWPLRPVHDVSFPKTASVNSTVSEHPIREGAPLDEYLLARSGRVEISVDNDGKFRGSFDVTLVPSRVTTSDVVRRIAGTFAGSSEGPLPW
jgi:hypothetical protein